MGGWALVVVGIILIPLPGPGWLVVGIGLLVLGREVRWARGALVRLERFMRRHGMRTSLRRLIARRQRERVRHPGNPSVEPMDLVLNYLVVRRLGLPHIDGVRAAPST